MDYGFTPGSTAQDRRARNLFSRRANTKVVAPSHSALCAFANFLLTFGTVARPIDDAPVAAHVDSEGWGFIPMFAEPNGGTNSETLEETLSDATKSVAIDDAVIAGAPLEEVAMVRDEMANLVFGIETRVPMVTGTSKPGGEAGREFLQAMERIHGAPAAPPAPVATVRFQLMNTVAEHWIPFLPVHVTGSRLIREPSPSRLNLDGSPKQALLREGEPGPAHRFRR